MLNLKDCLAALLSGGVMLASGCHVPRGTGDTLLSCEAVQNSSNKATYRVSFKPTWMSENCPDSYPEFPWWPHIYAFTHATPEAWWKVGKLTSSGFRDLVLSSKTEALIDEARVQIAQGEGCSLTQADPIFRGEGNRFFEIDVEPEHSYLSFVATASPSPDWFAGLSGLALIEDGEWIESKDFEIVIYDAGLDSGDSFESEDQPLDPIEAISEIKNGPFVSCKGKLGKIVVEKIGN